jgi:predicted cupin superfamily sugar epimerase
MSIEKDLIKRLNLVPLAGEGGFFSEIYRDDSSNAIYFLIISPDFSAWHRIPQPEMWLHLSGDPLELYTIENDSLQLNILGHDVGNLHYRVSAQTWMAARSTGNFSLMSCSLTPAFTGMELATRDSLFREFPKISDIPELFHV